MMSDSLKTSLSAFVDGEASTDESSQVFEQLAEDEDWRTEWRNYHSISAVLRNEGISNLQSPLDWATLSDALPANRDVLPFRPRNRIKSMLFHGGIGASLAACIMVAIFFIFSNNPTEPNLSGAIATTPQSDPSQSFSPDVPSTQPFPFGGSFEISISMVPPEFREDIRQMELDALLAHDISRSGIERSLMHDANVISRNVSQDL